MSWESLAATGVRSANSKFLSTQETAGPSSFSSIGMAERTKMPASPQTDAIPKSKEVPSEPDCVRTPELSDPLKTEIPRPYGDPFEQMLEPMLKKDSDRCSAWVDEVQGILIFAGLFSAVVTAFIIESYQRLQPDTNDIIVGLLAHIADRLDNATVNDTLPVSSIIANTSFSPSSADININIFWFISLILNLTAALIGIIVLQWLREHQRYDPNITPQQKMAMLHMRLDSLERWHVPKVFAGLPLLLQGALILFFAGLIEFLFALRPEVAIPVTLSICTPLIFLICTTVLPTLQVCTVSDPFQLSINDNIPSPCPYKSPQSLIIRRFAMASSTVLMLLTFTISCVYICIIQINFFIRKIVRRNFRLPVFHTRRINLRKRLVNLFRREFSFVNGDWTVIDSGWLELRTRYAVSLEISNRDDADFDVDRLVFVSLRNHVYDCAKCCLAQRLHAQRDVFYHCGAILFSQVVNETTKSNTLMPWHEAEGSLLHIADLLYAFGRMTSPWISSRSPAPAFIEDLLRYETLASLQSTVGPLQASWRANWASQPLEVNKVDRDASNQLLENRSKIQPERLFQMTSGVAWLPQFIFGDLLTYRKDTPYILDSKFATTLLFAFFKDCSTLQPNSHLVLHHAPANKGYNGISAYMKVMSLSQESSEIAETLLLLTQLCSLDVTPDLIQEKPFLTIAACCYLEHVDYYYNNQKSQEIWTQAIYPEYRPLLNIIRKSFGEQDWGSISSGESVSSNKAINMIWKHHNSHKTTDSSASHIAPQGWDDIV